MKTCQKVGFLYCAALIVLFLIFKILYQINSLQSKLLPLYINTSAIQRKLIKQFTEDNNKENFYIPRIIHQTYSSRENVPLKVKDMLLKYAKPFQYNFYDNQDANEFLKRNFSEEVSNKFESLKLGPHKADLLRYCILYIYGGIYLDIKTELFNELNSEIFPDGYVTTVLACLPNRIYNGIIAAPPKQPIFLFLIDSILKTHDAPFYHTFIKDFFDFVKKDVGMPLKEGTHHGVLQKYNLVTEHCSIFGNKCNNEVDKYGLCSNVQKNNITLMNTRFADFPWDKNGQKMKIPLYKRILNHILKMYPHIYTILREQGRVY